MEQDNNEGVMDSMMALNAQNGRSMIKPTIIGDINLDIMGGITPRVMREINLDNNELSNGKELNRKVQHAKLKVEEFIAVPIAYVGNMVKLGNNFQRETLASHEFEGQSHVPLQTIRPKTSKWTKIAREASANNITLMGRIEIGKKKYHRWGKHRMGPGKNQG